MKRILLLASCLVTLAACGDSALPNPTGKGFVRTINAIPGSPPVRFLVEEFPEATVPYKSSSSPEDYDDFSYTFNFEVSLPGEVGPTRVGSVTLTVEKDRQHMFFLSGDINNPDITVWDGDVRTFDAADTVFETRFAHGGTTLGDIDIYLDPVGTALGTNPPAASLSFGEINDPVDFEAGDYVLTVTAANDVSTVYFTSQQENLQQQLEHVITVFDADANDAGTVAVRAMASGGRATIFDDATEPPRVRFIHTSFENGPVDIYSDEQLTSLVAANLPFGGATADLDSATDATTYYFTPAGSTAQVLFEQQLPEVPPGTFLHAYIIGPASETILIPIVPDRAGNTTSSKLAIYHGAVNFNFIDAYLVDRGTEFNDESRAIMLRVRLAELSPVVELLEGSYDLYLTRSGSRELATAAYPLDLVNGSVFDLIAVDTVDPDVIELIDVPVP